MKAPVYFAVILLLSGCIPIGVRGTSVVNAGQAGQTAAATASHTAAVPYRGSHYPRRA